MSATLIVKIVRVKKNGKYKLYDSAKASANYTEKTINTNVTFKATKQSGNFYYISDLKKWMLTSDLKTDTAATKTELVRISARASFKNPNTKVLTYKSATAISPYNTRTPGTSLYTILQASYGRVYIKEWEEWVKASLVSMDTVTGIAPKTSAEKIQEYKTKIQKDESVANRNIGTIVKYNSTNAQSAANDLPIKTPIGVYGMPYQFSKTVDRKLSGTTFGQYYADRVVSRMPLLILSPGKVNFMKASSGDDRQTIRDTLASIASGADTDIAAYLASPGKYYTFDYDPKSYWDYVNTMNHACATYLGIQDVKIKINNHSEVLSRFKWENATNSAFGTSWLQGSESFVSFYVDSDSTAGEDFSNTTTQSMLAGTLNKSSELGREIRFLLGEHGKLEGLVNVNTINEALEQITNLTSGVMGENNIVTQLSKEFAVIATGGKLIFPELWDDSSYTKDFDCKIKLRCPCPNKLAWYLDICVPLNHLLAFTLPRTPHGSDIAGQLLTSDITANGYFSPFLVRGFYKGISSVDMGIVTGLRIDKGKEGSWTMDTLPTEVDVSLTIKDLYSTMSMSSYEHPFELMNNTQFLSYLAFNCGIAINQPDIVKSATLYGSISNSNLKNNFIDKITGYNFWQRAKQNIRNKITSFYTGGML